MKLNSILSIVPVLILMFVIQGANGQENLNYVTKGILEGIANVKKQLEAGNINKSNWEEDRNYVDYIKEAGMPDKRQDAVNLYSQGGAAEKKALTKAYDDLAKAMAAKGITFATENDPNKIIASNPAYKSVLDDIKQVISYMEDPKVGSLKLNPTEHEWLVRAVSQTERKDWANTFFNSSTESVKAVFNKELDKLTVAASKSLPITKPNAQNFTNRNASEEKLMMNEMVPGLKVHKIGVVSTAWKIDKNQLDIPINRYKTGYMWIRNANDDHPYCKLCQLSIIQDYSGGGTYGQSYGNFLSCWLVGCP